MSNFYGSYIGFGAGAGAVAAFHGSGKEYGQAHGSAPGPYTNDIQKFSLTSSSDATDVSDLTTGRGFCGGCSSTDYGFCVGGGYPATSRIDKQQFATTNNAVTVGELGSGNRSDTSCTTSSTTHGFNAGGYPHVSTIDKFDFSATANSVGHGDLHGARGASCPMFSETHGYSSGGSGPSGGTQRDEFAFASNTTASDHGDQSGSYSYANGTTDGTNGYTFGGSSGNHIDKVAFATGGTAGDWGDLVGSADQGCAVSQTDYGYKGGGGQAPNQNRIQRFPWASDGGATDTTALMRSINAAGQSYGYQAGCQW